ncbi:MAG: cytochrome c oxidase subunit II [Gemmatimonadaceae bacterium]
MSWLLPPGASTFTGEIDWLYYLILGITGIAFVIVEVMLVVFLFRYRARAGRKATYYHGNTKFEIIWTSVTAIVVVIIGILSAGRWNAIKGRDSVPPNAVALGVHAKQFEWLVTYPGADATLGSADDFEVRGQMHLAVNQPVAVTLTSEDAIHSFFVPAFRIKQDAVPGMSIKVWFQPTQVGEYELGCAELCGLGHYRMRATVTVHSQEDYDTWLRDRAAIAATK